MDASKYAWAGVLTQAHDHIIEGKERTILHPITYVSGLFRGSQVNWANLTKVAYAIYMSIKKLPFNLYDAGITLRSDHLPLKRVLEKNTLNLKVNNWAVEIEQYQIKFEYIKGIKNTLAVTMSRLIAINCDTCQDPEPEGQGYRYSVFEELPNISTIKKVLPKADITLNEIMVSLVDSGTNLKLNVTNERLCQLQQEDPFCKRTVGLIKSSKLQANNPYYIKDKLLMRNIIDNKQCFHIMVLPWILITLILRAAHGGLDHNGTTRTYNLVHRLFYWKGLKASVNKHIKQCMMCQKRNVQVMKYGQLHFSTSRLPIQFIPMDLIGPFDPSSNGHHYTLIVICILTGYTFCIPLKTKTPSNIVQAYIDEVYAKFRGSRKILSDSGTI